MFYKLRLILPVISPFQTMRHSEFDKKIPLSEKSSKLKGFLKSYKIY